MTVETAKLLEQGTQKSRPSLWHKTLVLIISTALYAGFSWITSFALISGTTGGELRPGVAIPIVTGFLYGPIIGFLCGFLGNLTADYILGYLPYLPDPSTGNLIIDLCVGYYLNWQIGNGLFGLIPGLWKMFHDRFRRISDLIGSMLVSATAIVVGVGFAAFTDIAVYDFVDFDYAMYQNFQPIVQVNLIYVIILVPIILFNYDRLNYRSLPSFNSGLMRRLLITLLLSAALPVGLLGLFLVQQNTADSANILSSGLAFKLALTIVLTLVFTVFNALLIAQTVSRPILRIAEAARLVETNELTQEHIDELNRRRAKDEITQLGHVFARMAQEVISREQKLKQEVSQLRIEIDRVKQQEQVKEIVNTDFFSDLQSKAKNMRRRNRRFSNQNDT